MENVFLYEICSPKQWKTISSSKLLDCGYPVYGANGKIGFYSEYTHSEPTILITCRGATCGTINVCEPQSYVNGNAMALDKLSSKVSLDYLKYILVARGLDDVISGSAQPQITRTNLNRIKIPVPSLTIQKRIADILDNAAARRDKAKQLLREYEQLAQSIFLEMFGNPVENPFKWEEKKMDEICRKVTDGTHDTPERLTKGITFITGKHIRPYKIDFINCDYVASAVHKDIFNRCNPELDDVLYTNIGVNLGTAALNPVEYEFSMKNVALLKPNSTSVLGRYLEYFLNSKNMKEKILWIASIGGAQKFLSLNQLRKLKVLVPPIELQKQFAEKVTLIEAQKELVNQELKESENLFQALLQKAFKGELIKEENYETA